MNVIFGAGGFAREVGWLFEEVARSTNSGERIDAFVASDDAPNLGTRIHGATITSESEFFAHPGSGPLKIFVGVGSPGLRERLHRKCLGLQGVEFPSLIHPSVQMDRRPGAVRVGAGAMVCAGSILTTDVTLGDFVQINLNCTVGHDARIGAFSTLSPGVHISGGVELGRSTFVGTGAVLLENIRVPEGSVIGAGATVVRTLTESGTYVGTPARLRQ